MADLGDVPGWIEAVATSLAFAGTTTLLWFESQRRAEEREQRIESQACKVAHWLDRDRDGVWSLKYRNVSEVPVYRIQVHAYVNGHSRGSEQMKRIHPDASEQTRRRINRWLNEEALTGYVESDLIGIDLVFVDANGRGWARDLDGFLVKLKSKKIEPPPRLAHHQLPHYDRAAFLGKQDQIEHEFDGHEQVTAARCRAMRTIRTWLAFRREGRGLSLIKVARGWQ